MNRKDRRANLKQRIAASGVRDPADLAGFMHEAQRKYEHNNFAEAEILCRQILDQIPTHVLDQIPTHVHALNMLGLIAQASDRHRMAVKMFSAAIAADPLNAVCHYNLASSYQAIGKTDETVVHFKKAIGFGLGGKNIADFILQNPGIANLLSRLEHSLVPLNVGQTESLREDIARDLFLRSALETTLIGGSNLERLLTYLRAAFLLRVCESNNGGQPLSERQISCVGALAQQYFINEYLYCHGDEEFKRATALRDSLVAGLLDATDIASATLVAVAMYFPLYKLPHAEMLLQRRWTKSASSVVRQQLEEPFEEARDYAKIPTLTSIDDAISLKVMRQYEENPFPRWTVEPAVPAIGEASLVQAELAIPSVILIAGSGSGRHAYQVANQFPKSRILAVDISILSLAYSRRKMRENSVHNVDFAQADILKIGDIGRTFDRIEVVGVLHHLEDPEAGLRILLSLLRPGGEMRIGLYSERARAKIIEARAMIAARGYRPTAEDIRRCRQEILQNDQACDWTEITSNEGFYSITGCRDFLFNVMEHRFTIPKIAKLLNRYHLSFLGSNPPQKVLESFMAYYPASALTDLQCWNDFEVAHPLAFRHMYVFTIRKPL